MAWIRRVRSRALYPVRVCLHVSRLGNPGATTGHQGPLNAIVDQLTRIASDLRKHRFSALATRPFPISGGGSVGSNPTGGTTLECRLTCGFVLVPVGVQSTNRSLGNTGATAGGGACASASRGVVSALSAGFRDVSVGVEGHRCRAVTSICWITLSDTTPTTTPRRWRGQPIQASPRVMRRPKGFRETGAFGQKCPLEGGAMPCRSTIRSTHEASNRRAPPIVGRSRHRLPRGGPPLRAAAGPCERHARLRTYHVLRPVAVHRSRGAG